MFVAFSVAPSGAGDDRTAPCTTPSPRPCASCANRACPTTPTRCSPTIEGEWDEVFAVIKPATEAVGAFGPRVSLVLKADIRPGRTGELDGKVERLEAALERDAAASSREAARRSWAVGGSALSNRFDSAYTGSVTQQISVDRGDAPPSRPRACVSRCSPSPSAASASAPPSSSRWGCCPNLAADLLPGLYASAPDAANAQAGWLISRLRPRRRRRRSDHRRRRRALAAQAACCSVLLDRVHPGHAWHPRCCRPSSSVLAARFVAALPHGAYFGIASLVAASLMGPGKRAQRRRARALRPHDRECRSACPRSPGSARLAGWRIAYLAVAAIFALTFVAVAALRAVPAGRPDGHDAPASCAPSAARRSGSRSASVRSASAGSSPSTATSRPLVTEVTGLGASAVPSSSSSSGSA